MSKPNKFSSEFKEPRRVRKEQRNIRSEGEKMKRRYACDIDHCVYSSSKLEDKIVHQRIHNGDKPFMCIECEFQGRSRIILNNHRKKFHSSTEPKEIKDEEISRLLISRMSGISFCRDTKYDCSTETCQTGVFSSAEYLSKLDPFISVFDQQVKDIVGSRPIDIL